MPDEQWLKVPVPSDWWSEFEFDYNFIASVTYEYYDAVYAYTWMQFCHVEKTKVYLFRLQNDTGLPLCYDTVNTLIDQFLDNKVHLTPVEFKGVTIVGAKCHCVTQSTDFEDC